MCETESGNLYLQQFADRGLFYWTEKSQIDHIK
jgi:hypothetical protein